MTDPTLRPARPRDLIQIHSMIRALSAYHGDTATVTLEALQEMAFDAPHRFDLIVAERKGQLIGYAGLAWHQRLHSAALLCDIHHLYVVEQERSKGVGRLLIDAAEAAARARGAMTLTIGTDPANTGAQAAYRAIGMEEITDAGPRFRRRLSDRATDAA